MTVIRRAVQKRAIYRRNCTLGAGAGAGAGRRARAAGGGRRVGGPRRRRRRRRLAAVDEADATAGGVRCGSRRRGWRGGSPRPSPGRRARSAPPPDRRPAPGGRGPARRPTPASRRSTWAHDPHSTPPCTWSNAHRSPTDPHTTHSSRYGWKPSSGQQLQEEGGHQQRGVVGGQGPQRPQQHLVQPEVGLALLRHLVDRLEQRRAPVDSRSRSSRTARKRVDRLGLGDDVELAAPRRAAATRGTIGSSRDPKRALGLAHALGHRPHLAPARGQQHDDAVGLAQLVGPQHDPVLAVEAGHDGPATWTALRPLDAPEAAVAALVTRAPPRRGAPGGSRATARR